VDRGPHWCDREVSADDHQRVYVPVRVIEAAALASVLPEKRSCHLGATRSVVTSCACIIRRRLNQNSGSPARKVVMLEGVEFVLDPRYEPIKCVSGIF
jgi:hypothetical protein